MPAKGTKKVTPAQRAKLAAGKLGGKSVRALAAETGLATSTVQKQLHDARTGSLLLDFRLSHKELYQEGMLLSVKKIIEQIQSPDPELALKAAWIMQRASALGDVAIKPDPLNDPNSNRRRGDFTLEELVIAYIQGVQTGNRT